MKRILTFLGLFTESWGLGLMIAISAFITMTDVVAVETIVPMQMGFRWQGEVLRAAPISCAIGCLLVFLASPVGNDSRYTLQRGIGKITIGGRYFLFAEIVCCAVLLGILSLNVVVSYYVQSLKLPDKVPYETISQIRRNAGPGITSQGDASGTRLIFLKEKRAAVLRALQKEHISAEE
jgi:hypothetical protein